MIEKSYKEKLKNGLRVVIVPVENTEAITASLYVGTGSHHEKKELSGISHYLEHLVFKGSKKYKTPYEIVHTMDSIGAQFNAATSEEMTYFYAKVVKDNIEKALDVISDFLINPLFSEQEIERERGVILEELNMYYDDPRLRIYSVLGGAMYGDQPAGREIGGTPESVKSITKKDVVDYFNNQYKANNMVLVMAGKITHENGLKLAKKYFGDVRSGDKEITKLPVGQIPTSSPVVQSEDKKTDQAHICIGFPAFPMRDTRRYALKILSIILGGGMSSRLFMEVREKHGLCYTIRASSELGTDYGIFYIYSGVTKEKTSKAIEIIVGELNKMKDKKALKEEVEKAKNIIKAYLLLGLEGSDAIAHFWGEQEALLDEVETPKEHLDKINVVTPEEVQKVAKDIFIPSQAKLAMISPIDKTEKLGELFLKL